MRVLINRMAEVSGEDRPHNAAITSLQIAMRGAPHNNAMNTDHGILPCGGQGG